MPLQALRAGLGYLRRNPLELVYAAKHAAGLRIVVPLNAVRWLLARLPQGKRTPKDVVLGTRPPSLTVGLTVDLMGNGVRLETAVDVEELRLGPDELRIALRLSDFRIHALDPQSPAAQLFGAIDKSKPANLASFLPKRPAALVEAKDDRIVLDLMKVPKIGENARLRKILGIITPVLVLRELRADDDHLVISWRTRPTGFPTAVAAIRG